MRLSEARIKEAILHPETSVRNAAVEYFAESYSRDAGVMPLVIQSVEKYGRAAARYSVVLAHDLAQTEATVDWAVEELRQKAGDQNYRFHVARVLLDADPRLVRTREEAVLGALADAPKDRAALQERLEMLSWDAEKCWSELWQIAERGKGGNSVSDVPYDRAMRIAKALAPQGEGLVGQILPLLAEKVVEFDNNPMLWMECFLIYLAGEMRLEPAIPMLVEKMHEEGEIVNEECMYALAKIGTESAADALASEFVGAEEVYRLYVADTLGRIHSDASVRGVLAFLPGEEDGGTRANLANALLENFAFEGVEVVRQIVLDGSYDRMMLDLKEALVDACRIMGVSFPGIDAWEKEVRDNQAAAERRMAALENWSARPIPPLPPAPRPKRPSRPKIPLPSRPRATPAPERKHVGRNDPCPCGSGKKFKVCCMKKG